MFAGSYDFIEECRRELGDEYIDQLLDAGYEPYHVPGEGWSWMQVTHTPVARNTSTLAHTSVNLVVHIT